MDNTPEQTSNESSPCVELLQRAVEAWKKAQVVYQVPSWEGKPEARFFVEQMAVNHPECESGLVGLLNHERQLVVAYALLTLEMMGSFFLRSLPSDLLERRSRIKLMYGSVATAMDLGGLARQIQKRAKEREQTSSTG